MKLSLLIIILISGCSIKKNSNQDSRLQVSHGDIIKTSSPGYFNVFAIDSARKCSAVLIDEKLFITAAHCISGGAGKAYFKNNPEDNSNIFEIHDQVIDFKAIKHPYYNSENVAIYDFAVGLLSSSPPEKYFSRKILPSNMELKVSDELILTGVGLDENNKLGVLKETKRSLSQIAKNRFLVGVLVFEKLEETGVCNGDSGGPAYIKRGDEYYIAGILQAGSGAAGCEHKNLVDFYSMVSEYLPWLRWATIELGIEKEVVQHRLGNIDGTERHSFAPRYPRDQSDLRMTLKFRCSYEAFGEQKGWEIGFREWSSANSSSLEFQSKNIENGKINTGDLYWFEALGKWAGADYNAGYFFAVKKEDMDKDSFEMEYDIAKIQASGANKVLCHRIE